MTAATWIMARRLSKKKTAQLSGRAVFKQRSTHHHRTRTLSVSARRLSKAFRKFEPQFCETRKQSPYQTLAKHAPKCSAKHSQALFVAGTLAALYARMIQPDFFNDATPAKAHPFELAGMGSAPFTVVGFWSFPSQGLAETNPDAYRLALQEMPKLKGGCGTCANCGAAIRNICIVRNAVGEVFGVGCDCVEKTGEPGLCDPAKIALAKHRRAQAQALSDARREARRIKWLAAVNASTGETNAQRIEREAAEAAAAEAARIAKAAPLAEFADALADGRGGFCDSIAADLRRGFIPSGRGLQITLEILAKRAGRRGSKAFDAEFDRVSAVFESLS